MGSLKTVCPTVLRIRDVYPGSYFYPSRIPDPKAAMKDRGGKKLVVIPFLEPPISQNLKLFIFESAEEKNLGQFERIIELFTKKIVTGSGSATLMSNSFPNFCSNLTLFPLRLNSCRVDRCCTRCAASPTCRRCRRASSRPWSGSCARILPRWSASPGTSQSSRSGSPTTGTSPPLLSKRGYN